MRKRCITYTIGRSFFRYDGRFFSLAFPQCPCSSSAFAVVHGVVNRPRLAKTGEHSLNRCGRTGMGIFNFEMGNLRNGNLIGRNVSRFRYQQSWTQEELAAKMQLLGCFASTSAYESCQLHDDVSLFSAASITSGIISSPKIRTRQTSR